MAAANQEYLLVRLTASDYDEREVSAFAIVTPAYFQRTRAAIEQLDSENLCLDVGIDGTVEWASAEDLLADIDVKPLTRAEVESLERIFPIKDKDDDIVAGFGHYRFMDKVRENLGIGF